jgi:hypothetical protein
LVSQQNSAILERQQGQVAVDIPIRRRLGDQSEGDEHAAPGVRVSDGATRRAWRRRKRRLAPMSGKCVPKLICNIRS